MKKILSVFLVLTLLLGMAGCAIFVDPSAPAAQATEQAAPDGTTLPLYWPPLPEETEEETQPPELSQPPEQTQPPQQDDEPVQTQPVVKPTTPVVTEPVQTEPVQTQPPETEPTQPPTTQPPAGYLDPNGTYDSKKDVALYIHLYGRLPSNYITKKQAERLGWDGGSVERYAPGKCIGGDRFYNNEGLLPKGHTYYECDIGTLGKSSRGAQRIVYSSDGLIYYTSNHYKSFTLLYGSP